jgi:hypothetical protein
MHLILKCATVCGVCNLLRWRPTWRISGLPSSLHFCCDLKRIYIVLHNVNINKKAAVKVVIPEIHF